MADARQPSLAHSTSAGSFEKVALDEITPADQSPTLEPSQADLAAAAVPAQPAEPEGRAAAEPEGISSFLPSFSSLFGGGSSSTAAWPPGEKSTAVEDPIKELEQAASAVAQQAGRAAKVASSKLVEGAAGLTSSLSSWFSNLEQGGSHFSLGGGGGQPTHQDLSAIQESLELDAGEAVLESFGCQLLQTYACTNNPFTPERQVAFGGSLHITSQRVFFLIESEKGLDPVKLDIKALKGVQKEPAAGGLPERLVLALSEDGRQTLVLVGFTLKEMEMDSALALLEHLTSD